MRKALLDTEALAEFAQPFFISGPLEELKRFVFSDPPEIIVLMREPDIGVDGNLHAENIFDVMPPLVRELVVVVAINHLDHLGDAGFLERFPLDRFLKRLSLLYATG
jgi:hypothetical protein